MFSKKNPGGKVATVETLTDKDDVTVVVASTLGGKYALEDTTSSQPYK